MSDVLLLVAFWSGVVYLVMVLVSRKRERALAEARTSEARFRSLTELSADWFWETDAEHRVTWISGGAPVLTFFGSTPTFGKRLWEIPRVEVDERALRALLERLGRELPFFDLEISRADERGARQIHIISGHCRKGADGAFLGYRGVGRDVTGERRAERGLAEAKARLERALDGGNVAEWHLDVSSGEIDVGDGWVRFLGYERSAAVTRLAQMLSAAHPDDGPAARAALVRAVKGELPEYSFEARLPMKGGGWKWLHARGRVTERDAEGRALRMSGTFADIDERKRAEAALREAETRYRSLVEIAPDGLLVHSGSLIEYANAAMARLLKAREARELIGRRIEEFVHPDHAQRARERLDYLATGPGVTPFEERRLVCVDGSEIVTEVGAVSYLDRGRMLSLAMFRDVSESRKTRAALAAGEQRFRDVAEATGELVWETDAEGRFTYLSERVEAVLGYTQGELLGRRGVEFLPLGEERAVREWAARNGVAARGTFRDLPLRMIAKSGGVVWLSVSGVAVRDPSGGWAGWRGTAADATARRRAEARIEYLVQHDPLTGLASRAQLAERGAQALAEAARNRNRLAVLAIDLDRFRLVNQALGHAAGDALLRAVGERLQNAVRREDTLARAGGDDFLLLWPDLRSREEAARLAQRVLDILGRPFTVEGQALSVGASVGVALYPEDGRDFGELLRHADAALYQAKENGAGTYRFYGAALGAAAAAKLRGENELRGALARGELLLHWQPVVRGRGRLVGAEALVRWQHPKRGLLMPEEFLSLAEECGLTGAVGDWTLERALSQVGAWQRTLPRLSPNPLWFAVNVTAPELAEGEVFFQKLKSSLEAHRLEGSRLELEVTERVLMSHLEENVATLRRIGELGVRFAVDDFGTGYSSLAYLRGLPVDKLKIDRMFLRSLDSNAADQAIVRAIAALARALGVSIAAEGIENAAQLERLLSLGCDDWQGHYFSAPLSAADFEKLVAKMSDDNAQEIRL